MPSTIGMKDAGFYDRHSTPQLEGIQYLLGWAEQALAGLTLPPVDRPVTIADYGSSEGRNATITMSALCQALRQRTQQPIATIYSDLPSNNFNQLCANLEQARAAGRFPENVHASLAPGSFYGPILPSGSVHFATCFSALLWLDQLPGVALPEFVVYRRPTPRQPRFSISEAAIAAFTRQAEQDLYHFLECRARELAPGGKLLIGSPGDDTDERICDGIYDLLNDACLDLVQAGRVERSRYERLTVPVYFRTVEELVAPLERPDSPVRGSFTLDRAETFKVPTAFMHKFQQNGNVDLFADDFTGFLRAFSEPVVRAALVGPGGDVGLMDELFAQVHTRLLREPNRYFFRYIMVAVLLTRTGSLQSGR